VTVNVPSWLGVPEMTPVEEFIVSPPGSAFPPGENWSPELCVGPFQLNDPISGASEVNGTPTVAVSVPPLLYAETGKSAIPGAKTAKINTPASRRAKRRFGKLPIDDPPFRILVGFHRFM
jgi:hypothetical protein